MHGHYSQGYKYKQHMERQTAKQGEIWAAYICQELHESGRRPYDQPEAESTSSAGSFVTALLVSFSKKQIE